jgi:hypothetical protein
MTMRWSNMKAMLLTEYQPMQDQIVSRERVFREELVIGPL